jgi:thiamine pyrophosphate-dependent acetolactate synthase large subunit-like protein
MDKKIQVNIDPEVFNRLQKVATPLIDDTNSVIVKLLDLWERKANSPINSPVVEDQVDKFWIAARGERFPVGLKLRASYYDQKFDAVIGEEGILLNDRVFDSPSSAAIHAKYLAGTKGASASTNGWTFWEYLDEKSERWFLIDNLRK